MANKLSTNELAEKIVEQYGIVEEVLIYKYDEKNRVITDKVDHKESTVHIPETLLGINLAGYGKKDKEAKADLAERLAKVLDSDDIDLADDWADRHLDKK